MNLKPSKILFFLVLYSTLAFSQKEASVWYFGKNAGLKFNDNDSVTALTDGQLDTYEGCATIADAFGNLLFYTDGRTVWDKNHIIMPNGNFASGTGLFGDPSSTQSAIIIPKPNNPLVYYIFTVDEPHNGNAAVYPNVFTGNYDDATSSPEDDDGLNNGFNYSIVDLSVTGSNGSIGDIVSRNNHLVTYNNNPLGEEIKFKCSEKITAIANETDNSYWVLTHFINNFYAFKISSLGVDPTPVVSTLAPTINYNGYRRNAGGYLKASPDGEKIAIAHNQNINIYGDYDFYTGSVYVYDFNGVTGAVSNPKAVLTGERAYGVEFSNNSNALYVSYQTARNGRKSIISQYNLLSSDIPSTKFNVFETVDPCGALQLGINNKIYFSNCFKNYLSVINNPDALGASCDFVASGIVLPANEFCSLGLPPFITSFFNVSFAAENLCFTDITSFSLHTNQTISSILWDFGDGFTSNSLNPNHQYAAIGDYLVTVTATTGTITRVKSRTITISQIPFIANAISNKTTCGNANMNYDLSQFNNLLLGSQLSSSFGVAYFSNSIDANQHSNLLSASCNLSIGVNTIYAKVYSLTNVHCNAITQFNITLFDKPDINVVNDFFKCDDVSNDGIAFFDLQSKINSILGSQSTNDFLVTFHKSQNDADANINILPLNFQNTSNPQYLFVRIENKLNTNCYSTNTFQIGLFQMPLINTVSDLILCDDISNDGIEGFDLFSQNNSVLGSQSPNDFTVSYHLSQNDADQAINELVSNFINTENPQEIFIRVENKLSTTCFVTQSFDVIVRKKPEIIMNDSYTICDGVPIYITAPNGFNSYLWSTSETTKTIRINEAGNYNLTVTQDYGDVICDVVKNIVVSKSSIATITDIQFIDWTEDENSITVNIKGDGIYEYSIDNLNFQDSNVFANLKAGEYTVYVKDKKECGIAKKTFYLLTYPKYFTPNGDGYNDKWQIKFSDIEPNMSIKIYDRYGKLIVAFFGNDFGWDGTLNNIQLPSDEYWFVIQRENGKEFKGHFSMKR